MSVRLSPCPTGGQGKTGSADLETGSDELKRAGSLADDYVAVLIIAVANRLTRGASKYYREVWNLGVVEWRVMVCLGYHDRRSIGEIAEDADLDKGAVSRAVKLLDERGLLTTESGVGRLNQASLTPAGRRLLEKLRAVGRRREARLMAGFTPEERPLLLSFLNRLLSQVDWMNARDANDEEP
jgi:DNA-binding MarR family transcriptional regulator